ncbi:LysM peptidoglycan-binding domain-containing protein [Lutispora sp.]|uniref:LysM peptidoglycan-binding domain-containing protein n=1 Tax=Lutispora sp. TaxID=2828727 RepID=UPI002B1FA1D0|nr:LysM peptidoglycan-binding domain-containing protein [Lutispora sp.]MEA4963873.1 LysM peptidoglycan-binding domain-containing protein [Lutispora sp.]
MELKLQNNKPKRSINISKKEKNLLLILLVAILFWFSYKFVLIPQGKAIEKLKTDKLNYENDLIKIQEILARENGIKREWENLNTEFIRVSEKYYQEMNQSDLMHMLNGIIDSGQLEVPSMSFRETEALELEGLQADYLGVSLPFRGSFTDLEVFLSQLRNSPKRLLIDQLSITKDSSDSLNGQLSFNAYAYGGAKAKEDGYFYTNAYNSPNKPSPFTAFDGYVEVPVYSGDSSDGETEEKRALLADLEDDHIYYMGTGSGVTGKVSRFGTAKYGKTSIRAEYFISTDYQPERAYVVLDDQDINIKYPPPSIGIWAFSYGYSPVTVGLRFQDMDGRKIDVELEKGVNWTGWKYISASPPQDINVYPLKLDRVYIELGSNRDDYGVLLFDRIEASYPSEDSEKEGMPSYVFYVVKPGDTLTSISESFYGSKTQYKRLAKDNGLAENSILEAGKVLVIQK